jgi:lipoyl(octanoyl) transferase
VPCGIRDHGVTSIEALTGRRPTVREVALASGPILERALDLRIERVEDLEGAEDPGSALLGARPTLPVT